jgi:hypothetical protein|tara:strand:- start:233 stop:1348 length:1116 start_codon:yes stop_codon:yes gene_type:complete
MKINDILMEKAGGARIQHLEDLIIWNGVAGARKAITSLHSLETSPQDTTIKWDGSPAVIFGRNEQGQFILTDKSGFGAKGYNGKATSADELEGMLKNRPGYAKNPEGYGNFIGQMKKVWPAFEQATPQDFRGYANGDLLWFDKPQVTDGKIVFMPNTTQYSVTPDSEIGKQISASEVGVVLHSFMDEEGNKQAVDISRFQAGPLLAMPPQVVTEVPDIHSNKLADLENFIQSAGSEIDKVLTPPVELKMKNFPDLIYNYMNASARSRTTDKISSKSFVNYLLSDAAKVSSAKQGRLVEYLKQHQKGLDAIFAFMRSIGPIKDNIIAQLDANPADIEASTGGQKGGEGYVIGKDVKLVNRQGFTAANMERNN